MIEEQKRLAYSVRQMSPADIPQVEEIDKEAFPTQWPPLSFKRELSNKLAHCIVAHDESASHMGEARETDDMRRTIGWMSRVRSLFGKQTYSINYDTCILYIGGYAIYWMMADEAHLTSIAVREASRRQGIGEMLLICVIDSALKQHARVVTLEVRASNYAAQALYEKYGFERVGERRSYYSDDKETAIIMTTEVITLPSYQQRLQRLKEAFVYKQAGILAPRFRQHLVHDR